MLCRLHGAVTALIQGTKWHPNMGSAEPHAYDMRAQKMCVHQVYPGLDLLTTDVDV